MNEKEVRAMLIRATEDRPPGIDLMATLPATPAARKRRVRVLVPLASLAVVTAVSMIVLAVQPSQPSAQAQVAAAVENTSQESYRLHATSGTRTFDGAFDPVKGVGVIAAAGEDTETRFVGDMMYIREPGATRWLASPRPEAELAEAPPIVAVTKLAALDPPLALQRLRAATEVRENGPASGQGWTGTRFTFSMPDAQGPGDTPEAVSGAVDVDDQGRVRRLEINFSDTGLRNVMEFSDFGTPVNVTAPPADQVEQQPMADKQGTDKPIRPEDRSPEKASDDKLTGNARDKAAAVADEADKKAGAPTP